MSRGTSMSTGWMVLLLAGLGTSVMATCSNKLTSTIVDVADISTMASCATYSGDISVTNISGTIDLTGMETLVGGFSYSMNEEDPVDITIESLTLKNVTGGLNMMGTSSGSGGRLNLSLLALESSSSLEIDYTWYSLELKINPGLNISGDLHISGFGETSVIDLGLNISAADSMEISSLSSSYPANPTLSSSVERIERKLAISYNDGFEKLLLDDLEFITNDARIISNTDPDYISMSVVDSGLLHIEDNGRHAGVSLPNLEKLGYRRNPYNPNRPYEGPSIPPYDPELGGIFRDLLNISLPLLKETYGDDSTDYPGKLHFTSNYFSELQLPHLEFMNCTLCIDNNSLLNNLWIPRLNYVNNLQVHNNLQLLNFTANLLKKADNINLTGSFTNIEFFSLETVTGDFFLYGDKKMDCSWFDEHFFNKIVKGTYKCDGNHTKPDMARKPSTPTDEAQLKLWESGKGLGPIQDEGLGVEHTGGRLATGAKVGIGIGIGVSVAVFAALAGWLFIRKKKQQDTAISGLPHADAGAEIEELHGNYGISRNAAADANGLLSNNTTQVEELPGMSRTKVFELPIGPRRAEL